MEYKPQPDRYTNGMLYRRCGDSGIQLPVISSDFGTTSGTPTVMPPDWNWSNMHSTTEYATSI